MVTVVTGIPTSWDSCTASADNVFSAVWSPCGQFIAGSHELEIQILDSTTLEKFSALVYPNGLKPRSLAFSPDGHLLACSFDQLSSLNKGQIKSDSPLIVWDTQTGVIINKVHTPEPGEIMFHGNQKTITLLLRNGHLYTYNVLDGVQLHLSDVPLSLDYFSVSHWAYEDSLQFAESLKTDEKHVINIKELQPTSTTPLHTLSSYSIPPQDGWFSFSSVLFHASFISMAEVVVLDIQNSKILLQTQIIQEFVEPGQFSPNGHFFTYKTPGDEICIWQNTPTGYLPWGSLRP